MTDNSGPFWVWGPFSALCLSAFLSPGSIAVCSIIILSHFDMSGGTSTSSASTLGLANTLKSLLLPAWLLFKLRNLESSSFPGFSKPWMFFTAYAAFASLWSPFALSAFKMVVYLVCYSILFCLIRLAWQHDMLTARIVFWLLVTSILIGIVQTYFTDNSFGSGEIGFTERFTSFCPPPAFAVFVVCCFVVIILSDLNATYKTIGMLLAALGLYLCGSRTYFASFVLIILFRVVSYFYHSQHKLRSLSYGLISIAVLLWAGFVTITSGSQNRLSELVNSQLIGNSVEEQLQSVSTFSWRLEVYGEAVGRITQRLEEGNVERFLAGSGTSSGGEILSAVDVETFNRFEDNNRAIHDEFLRILYEWGLIGFILFLVFLIALIRYALYQARRGNHAPLYTAMIVVIGLILENPLAGSVTPAGVGYMIALSYLPFDRDAHG